MNTASGLAIRSSVAAIALLLYSAVAIAEKQVLPYPESASNQKAKFAELANRFVGKGSTGLFSAWCPAFMQSVKDEKITFSNPVLETDDGAIPELSKYNRCKDQQFWDVQPGGWSPRDRYFQPGKWVGDLKIRTSDIQIIPWNLRYRSVFPDLGHRNFKLYRLPNLKKTGGAVLEVIYGEVDRDLDKTNNNYLRLSAPGQRRDSGYWIIDAKQCYAKWNDLGIDQSKSEKLSHHAIVQYKHEYYVLRFYPHEASPWVIDLELIGHRKDRISKWLPCRWAGDIR